jgi:hypothetical protein
MLTHPEIIVGTPHCHFTDAAEMVMPSTGKRASLALQIDEQAIASLATKTLKLTAKMSFVVHGVLPLTVAIDFREWPADTLLRVE